MYHSSNLSDTSSHVRGMAKHGTEFETHFSGKFFGIPDYSGEKKVPFFSWREVNVAKKTKEALLLLRNKG